MSVEGKRHNTGVAAARRVAGAAGPNSRPTWNAALGSEREADCAHKMRLLHRDVNTPTSLFTHVDDVHLGHRQARYPATP